MRLRSHRAWILLGLLLLAACGSSPPALTSDDPVEIASQAYELRMAGDVDDAIAVLRAGLDRRPDAGVLHYELSRARLYCMDFDAMQEEAEAAVATDPHNADYRYYAGMVSAYSLIDAAHHDDRGRMEAMGYRILSHLEEALQIDPDHHQARYLLVQQTLDMAPDVGIEWTDPEPHVLYLEDRDPILGAKARCCLVDEDEQRAIWTRILEEYPDDSRAQFEAAEGLIGAGRLYDARQCLDHAMETDPNACYGMLRLGLAYASKHDLTHAIAVTREFLEHDPPVALRAFALARLSVLQRQAGNFARAEQLRVEAKAVDPHVWFTMGAPPREIFTPVVPVR